MFESAPLIETPEATAPPGAEPAWFSGAGGAQLRAALFTPAERPRGSVVLSGGRTEPIEKYYETIADFLDRGFVVLAHDWRGQGLSHRDLKDRLKGHAAGYRTYLLDFQALLRAYEEQLPRPWIAVGHSMGGCLTLLALAQGERRFAGAVLSAPMLGLRTGKIPAVTAGLLARLNLIMGRGARYMLGQAGKPFDDDFDANILTHDRRRFARTLSLLAKEPQLALGAPTWGWLDFAMHATAYLARPERLHHVTVPVVIVSAGDDRLVDNAAQAAAVRALPQGKHIVIPDAHHEILMETDEMRNLFMKAFDALTGRVAPKPPPKPAAIPPAPVASPAAAPAVTAAAKPAAKKPAATRKPAARKPAARKPAAKKPAAPKAAKPAAAKKTAATRKPAAKKAAASKAAAPKAAAKPAAKKAPARKPAAKAAAAPKKPAVKPAVKKVAAKKPVARKPAARKPAAKKV